VYLLRKKIDCVGFWYSVYQLLLRTRFFVLAKFSVPIGSHMDVHRIYDKSCYHLFKCIFNLGPRTVNMLQAAHYLNPALYTCVG